MVRMVQPGHMKLRLIFIFSILVYSCKTDKKEEPMTQTEPVSPAVTPKKIVALPFDADSAFSFIKAQVDFGPRVPGSKAHAKCAVFMEDKLKSYGLSTEVQTGSATTFDGKTFQVK